MVGRPGHLGRPRPDPLSIVGMLNGGEYRTGGQRYALSRHGFARGRRFAVTERGPTGATFRLTADAQTLAIYPFQFELDVSFTVEMRRSR